MVQKSSQRATPPAPKDGLAQRIESRWSPTGEALSLERIVSELGDVQRYDVVAALRQLERDGKGEFSAARGGQKAAFRFKPAPRQSSSTRAESTSAGQRRAGPQRKAKRVVSVEPPRVTAAATETLEHSFHLRPGFQARLLLPSNVTRAELDRFCRYLQTLPFADRRAAGSSHTDE